MKVYFLQDVPGVARAGEIKDVAEGYARNYLIPRRLAVVATEAVIEQVKARQAAEARRAAREAEELRELAARLEGLTVTVKVRAGKEGRLYGSVTPTSPRPSPPRWAGPSTGGGWSWPSPSARPGNTGWWFGWVGTWRPGSMWRWWGRRSRPWPRSGCLPTTPRPRRRCWGPSCLTPTVSSGL